MRHWPPSSPHVSGRYYERCHEVPANPLADDPELARKLWEFSEAAIAEALGRAPVTATPTNRRAP